MTTKFEFVASDPLSNPKPGRKSSQIRSRCMQGKNKREGSRRSMREQRKLARVKEQEEQEEQRQVAAGENAQELVPLIRPSVVLNYTRFADTDISSEAKGLLLKAFAYDIANNSLSPFDCCVDFQSINGPSTPFEWLYADSAFLNSILTTSYAVHDFKHPGWSENPIASRKTVLHLNKTLALLQARMQSQYAYQEEPILYSVFNLAMLAAGFGEWKAAIAHLNGLQRIVQLCGDQTFLAARPKLHFKLDRIDLVWTLASGKEPFFTRAPTSWDPIFPLPRPAALSGPKLTSPPLHWDIRLSHAFTDLQDLCQQINCTVREQGRYNATRFGSVLTSLQSRLMFLRGELEEPMQELVRLAMLALITTTFVVPGRKMPYNWVGKELPEVFGRVDLRGGEGLRRQLVWALVVVASTVVGVAEGWVREAWVEVAAGLSWEEVRKVLMGVMWIEVAHDGVGEFAFAQLQAVQGERQGERSEG